MSTAGNSGLVRCRYALSALLVLAACRNQSSSDRSFENPEVPATATERDRKLVSPEQLAALIDAPPPPQWFGVTLAERKIGHASLSLSRRAERVVVASSLSVSRGDEGGAVELTEEREYDTAPPHRLLSVSSRESSLEEVTEIAISLRADAMERRETVDGRLVSSGGIARSRETLADPVSQFFARPEWLVKGERGDIVELDTVSGADERTNAHVRRVETTRLAGVSATTAEIELSAEGEAATVTTIGGGGLVLHAQVGAFAFIAADERAAKRGVVGIDLASSSVPVKRRIGDPMNVAELILRARFSGQGEIPSFANQNVESGEDGATITLSRGPRDQVSASERAAALVESGAVDWSDPEVLALATELTRGEAKRADKVRALVRWVYDNLTKRLATDLGSASRVLERRIGDCTEHSLLLIALARAAKIPAREVSGLVYLGDSDAAFGWHSWVEVELEGRWWPVDPSWGEFSANATHLALGIGDDSRWIALIGGLELEILAVNGN